MRRWLAVLAGLSVIVMSGVAIGQPDAESPSTTVESEQVVAIEEPKQPVPDTDYEKNWVRSESRDEPKAEEPAEPVKEEAPADTTPPGIQILHPEEGQVFETKKVVFEGTTEPGARVFAGEYEADVDDAGNWRIVLFLSPGSNQATLRAKDAAGIEDCPTVTGAHVDGGMPSLTLPAICSRLPKSNASATVREFCMARRRVFVAFPAASN